MKERPILFNGDMVRALLEGRKTQTRRVVKYDSECIGLNSLISVADGWARFNAMDDMRNFLHTVRCPYGQPGDRLWVRETHIIGKGVGGYAEGVDPDTNPNGPTVDVIYRATYDGGAGPWRPSIFMPRWASRIMLEIVSVRVERLQEISEADAKAEGLRWNGLYQEWGGVEPHPASRTGCPQWRWYEKPVIAFKNLWGAINGAESWAANPWVWVVEFKRVSEVAA